MVNKGMIIVVNVCKEVVKIFLLTLIGISLFFITGCGFIRSFSSSSRTYPGYLKEWLENPSCNPPCWENITPGVTTIQETYDTLKKVPGVYAVTWYPKYGEIEKRNELKWEYPDTTDSGYADVNMGVINLIRLNVYSNLFVKDVVSTYGFPSHLKIYDCRSEIFSNFCGVLLVYSKSGMVLDLFLPYKIESNYFVNVYPTSKVGFIGFYKPKGNDDPGKDYPAMFPVAFVEWRGYGTYP
jgi:hypothetical protein